MALAPESLYLGIKRGIRVRHRVRLLSQLAEGVGAVAVRQPLLSLTGETQARVKAAHQGATASQRSSSVRGAECRREQDNEISWSGRFSSMGDFLGLLENYLALAAGLLCP